MEIFGGITIYRPRIGGTPLRLFLLIVNRSA